MIFTKMYFTYIYFGVWVIIAVREVDTSFILSSAARSVLQHTKTPDRTLIDNY